MLRMKLNESVEVGDTVLCVTKITRGAIKLAINAPRNVGIKRLDPPVEADK